MQGGTGGPPPPGASAAEYEVRAPGRTYKKRPPGSDRYATGTLPATRRCWTSLLPPRRSTTTTPPSAAYTLTAWAAVSSTAAPSARRVGAAARSASVVSTWAPDALQ